MVRVNLHLDVCMMVTIYIEMLVRQESFNFFPIFLSVCLFVCSLV